MGGAYSALADPFAAQPDGAYELLGRMPAGPAGKAGSPAGRALPRPASMTGPEIEEAAFDGFGRLSGAQVPPVKGPDQMVPEEPNGRRGGLVALGPLGSGEPGLKVETEAPLGPAAEQHALGLGGGTVINETWHVAAFYGRPLRSAAASSGVFPHPACRVGLPWGQRRTL